MGQVEKTRFKYELKEVRGMLVSGFQAFWSEGTASAKVLRQECAYTFVEQRRSVWLEWSKLWRVRGEEIREETHDGPQGLRLLVRWEFIRRF